jgi:hypothetical protein
MRCADDDNNNDNNNDNGDNNYNTSTDSNANSCTNSCTNAYDNVSNKIANIIVNSDDNNDCADDIDTRTDDDIDGDYNNRDHNNGIWQHRNHRDNKSRSRSELNDVGDNVIVVNNDRIVAFNDIGTDELDREQFAFVHNDCSVEFERHRRSVGLA